MTEQAQMRKEPEECICPIGGYEVGRAVKTKDEACPRHGDVESARLKLAQDLFRVLRLEEDLTHPFVAHLLGLAQLFDRKQRDYGERNISDFREYGVVVRLNDKWARLKNLCIRDGRWDPKAASNEPIEDTLRDIAAYAVILLMLREGQWPR